MPMHYFNDFLSFQPDEMDETIALRKAFKQSSINVSLIWIDLIDIAFHTALSVGWLFRFRLSQAMGMQFCVLLTHVTSASVSLPSNGCQMIRYSKLFQTYSAASARSRTHGQMLTPIAVFFYR